MSLERPVDVERSFERYRSYLLMLARAQLNGRFGRRLDASDVVQQTLIKAYEAREQFRGKNDEELLAWLRKIMVHTLSNALRDQRREKRDIALERSLNAEIEDSSNCLAKWLCAEQNSASVKMAQAEQLLRISEAITALPEPQRDAIILKHFKGLSLAEVAKQLGRSP